VLRATQDAALADMLRPHLLSAADRVSARLGYRREHETGG